MRTAPHAMRRILAATALAAAVLTPSCAPPGVRYPDGSSVVKRRATLKDELTALLPEAQRKLPDAQEEARWLADTAYKAAAGISRVNGSWFPGWAGNALINMGMQDRGLCWHYQHDMYRELRRRPLKFFRIGCCVRDKEKLTEHNCVYVAAKKSAWPDGWVLDAWMWNGRLKVDKASELNQARWQDLPARVDELLSIAYKEGHHMPIEHWAVIKTYTGNYDYYLLPESRASKQYERMYNNVMQGMKDHPDSPTNY